MSSRIFGNLEKYERLDFRGEFGMQTPFDDIPLILREPVFEKAFATAEHVRFSPQLQEAYHKDRRAALTHCTAPKRYYTY